MEYATIREVPGRFDWGDYVALSYTWGDPKETREIVVNGKSVQVTVNLEAALRALRDKAPVKAGLKLWIDALCINQDDNDEKGVQVKRMADIYRQAFDVVVWLGPEADESWKALKLIEILSDSWEKDQGKWLREYLDSDENSLFKLRPPNEPSLIGCWHALRNLMFRPYWKRVWIIQELVVSRNSSPVLCG
ncbi:heterokaryon incompatibility, partial [Bimuria novae-zelandiae CBS 107.79]